MTSETTTLARPDGRGDDMSDETHDRFAARCTVERVEATRAVQCACCHATDGLRYTAQGDLLCVDDDACVTRAREQYELGKARATRLRLAGQRQ